MRDDNRLTAWHVAGLAAVTMLGIATIIGSGGGDDGATPPVDYLKITSASARDVAGTVIQAVGYSFALADAGGRGMSVDVEGAAARVRSFALRQVVPRVYGQALDVKPSGPVGPFTDPCIVSGSVTLSGNLASPDSLSEGDHFTAVFSDCIDTPGSVADGRVDLLIRAIEGNPATDVFLLDTYVEFTGFVMTENRESVTANGAFVLTQDSLVYPVVQTRVSGKSMEIGFGGDAATLTVFEHEVVEPDRSVLPLIEAMTASGTLASRLLAGGVDYETVTPVAGAVGEDPKSGEILITGADSATIRAVVSGTSVQLELDLDGDGSVDEVQTTAWADLAGDTAPGVTAVTAPIIVREVLAAANQFELTVRDAGAQFGPNGAFYNALPLISAAGAFGPVEPPCQLASGSASVTGQIAVPGTFSPADQFNGVFAACDQAAPPGQYPVGSIILTGRLDTVVDAYAPLGVGLTVSIAGHATGLNGATGQFAGTYSLPDPVTISVTGSSAGMQLQRAGVARALYVASTSVLSDSSAGPTLITSSISGVLYTLTIPGRYVCDTVSPLESYGDDDPATGPFSGTLRVVADDDSAVRLVAVDTRNARLDLDLDGDGSTDQTVITTWQALTR